MSAEIAFEYLAAAIESTRGTAIADPTHYLNATGTISFTEERHRPEEMRGSLIANYRSVRTQTGAEWEAEGSADVDVLPVLLNAVVAGNVTSPSTPSGATNARLWTFTPSATADNIESLSLFWGDPNVQMFRGAFGMADEMTVTIPNGDAVTWSVSGQCQTPVYKGNVTGATQANPCVITSANHGLVAGDSVTFASVAGMTDLNGNSYTVANPTTDTFELSSTDSSAFGAYTSGGTWTLDDPTTPSQTTGPLLVGQQTDVWLDTSSAIGTTQLSGRVVEAEVTMPTGVTYKRIATGEGGSLDFQAVGRGKRNYTASVTYELDDLAQLDLFRDDSTAKLRVRTAGSKIETVSGTDFYNYFQFDIYGPMTFTDWGDLEGTNRTVTFEIQSEYDSTAGVDFKAYVQNDNTSL